MENVTNWELNLSKACTCAHEMQLLLGCMTIFWTLKQQVHFMIQPVQDQLGKRSPLDQAPYVVAISEYQPIAYPLLTENFSRVEVPVGLLPEDTQLFLAATILVSV